MTGEERTVVKTTVPQEQKEIWVEHADEMGMTQSEFVRTMVQAGRRGFDPDPPETGSGAATPGVDGLRDRVSRSLQSGISQTFDEIMEPIIEDIETGVDEVLQSMMNDNIVNYSSRNGYKLVENQNGDN